MGRYKKGRGFYTPTSKSDKKSPILLDLFLEYMTFRILEYIAKQNNKSLPKFHTEWSFQEYQEHEKKPFHRNLKK